MGEVGDVEVLEAGVDGTAQPDSTTKCKMALGVGEAGTAAAAAAGGVEEDIRTTMEATEDTIGVEMIPSMEDITTIIHLHHTVEVGVGAEAATEAMVDEDQAAEVMAATVGPETTADTVAAAVADLEAVEEADTIHTIRVGPHRRRMEVVVEVEVDMVATVVVDQAQRHRLYHRATAVAMVDEAVDVDVEAEVEAGAGRLEEVEVGDTTPLPMEGHPRPKHHRTGVPVEAMVDMVQVARHHPEQAAATADAEAHQAKRIATILWRDPGQLPVSIHKYRTMRSSQSRTSTVVTEDCLPHPAHMAHHLRCLLYLLLMAGMEDRRRLCHLRARMEEVVVAGDMGDMVLLAPLLLTADTSHHPHPRIGAVTR